MAGLVLYGAGRVETSIQDLLLVAEIFAWEASARRSLRDVFSREGSSTSCMPNLDWSSDCAKAKICLKLRFDGVEARTLVEMSVRRRGVRAYSVERARRMSFLAKVVVEEAEMLFVWVSEETEAAGEDEEERRRRRGGEASLELSSEGSRCWLGS